MEPPAILVVDDNADGREIVRLYLQSVGFKVIEAATGPAALKQARAELPNLILLDLALPEMYGDEVTAQLKADAFTREIPIVIVTALPEGDKTRKRAMAAGAAETLYKPFTFKNLAEVIDRYIRRPRDPQF